MNLLALLGRVRSTCLAVATTTLIAAGCAAPPPKATAISEELPFEEAVAKATAGLVAQTQTLPSFLAKVESKINKRAAALVGAMKPPKHSVLSVATKLSAKAWS